MEDDAEPAPANDFFLEDRDTDTLPTLVEADELFADSETQPTLPEVDDFFVGDEVPEPDFDEVVETGADLFPSDDEFGFDTEDVEPELESVPRPYGMAKPLRTEGELPEPEPEGADAVANIDDLDDPDFKADRRSRQMIHEVEEEPEELIEAMEDSGVSALAAEAADDDEEAFREESIMPEEIEDFEEYAASLDDTLPSEATTPMEDIPEAAVQADWLDDVEDLEPESVLETVEYESGGEQQEVEDFIAMLEDEEPETIPLSVDYFDYDEEPEPVAHAEDDSGYNEEPELAEFAEGSLDSDIAPEAVEYTEDDFGFDEELEPVAQAEDDFDYDEEPEPITQAEDDFGFDEEPEPVTFASGDFSFDDESEAIVAPSEYDDEDEFEFAEPAGFAAEYREFRDAPPPPPTLPEARFPLEDDGWESVEEELPPQALEEDEEPLEAESFISMLESEDEPDEMYEPANLAIQESAAEPYVLAPEVSTFSVQPVIQTGGFVMNEEAIPPAESDTQPVNLRMQSLRHSTLDALTPSEPETLPPGQEIPFDIYDDEGDEYTGQRFEKALESAGAYPLEETGGSPGEASETTRGSGLLLSAEEGATSSPADPFTARIPRRPAREIFPQGATAPNDELLKMFVDDNRLRELFSQIEALQEEVV